MCYADVTIRQSPGMVIIEVDRDFERFDSLLGQHSWSKFLKNPTPEDMDKSSKIFYCRFNTGRLVQKNGGSSHYGGAVLCSPMNVIDRVETRRR
jgi:hypothetical protein